LHECGWQREKGFWEKGSFRLLVDEVGIFLFRCRAGTWERIQGLDHTSMRNLAATRQIVFFDQSSLSLESGLFSAAPVPHRKSR
jgi:hypothetical protein